MKVAPTPYAYLILVADALGQREDGIGGPAPDGPTSAEMQSAAELLRDVLERTDDGSATASQLNDAIQGLAAVSDKWIDPEADPLGIEAREFLEGSIYQFGLLLDQVVPQQKELRQKWADLRVLAHCANRTVRRGELNPPLFTRLWRNLFK
jgi:hypothetical protein